jgi:hypothetical protein
MIDQRTVLVVETKAAGAALVAAAGQEMTKGACHFIVLAPQFGNDGQTTGNPALTRMYQSFRPGLLGPGVEQIERPVRRRLEAEVGELRALGARADGDVVSERLMTAIGRHIRAGVATVIVSEPRHWLGLRSLATRIKLRYRVDVVRI